MLVLLDEGDLIERKQHTPFSKLMHSDIKSNLRDTVRYASLVLFVNNASGEVWVFKNRRNFPQPATYVDSVSSALSDYKTLN